MAGGRLPGRSYGQALAAATLIAAAPAPAQTTAPPASAPIAAAPASARPQATVLRVYFNHQRLAAVADDCAIVFERLREVPKTEAVAAAALRQLFAGPTEAERAAGYRSPFSAATAGLLKRVFIEHGTAYVDLHDPRALLPGVTSSCGAAEFGTQIERTLRQFPTVRRVILAIDGDPRSFYDWMGQDCDLRNDHCDASPLRRR
ncbi:MAG: GerMN domain-containing protein [Proteobacteria bacterium]|nr:GerMN domain-containing protein [Pseudomonadota bacterium]